MAYTIILLVVAIINSTRGAPMWFSSVSESGALAPSAGGPGLPQHQPAAPMQQYQPPYPQQQSYPQQPQTAPYTDSASRLSGVPPPTGSPASGAPGPAPTMPYPQV